MSIEDLLSENNSLLAQILAQLTQQKEAEWVSIVEAATRLHVSSDTVRRKVISKEWPAQRVGRSWRVNIHAVMK